MSLKIGFHSSIAKGFVKVLSSVKEEGGNAVQIFLKSPRSRQYKQLQEEEARNSIEYIKDNDMFLVGHCSYLLNFARSYEEDTWPVESLVNDMVKIDKLGGKGVVLHIGKLLEMDKETAYSNIKENVSKVLEKTPDTSKVILENTAGQGTEIGFSLKEIKDIFELFEDKYKQRIEFCIDTAHAFAAGYNISDKDNVLSFINDIEHYLGMHKVSCIHFNDSNREFMSRVDRHQDIGKGYIGEEGLKVIAREAEKNNIPLIMETPQNYLTYKEQIDKVKTWVGHY